MYREDIHRRNCRIHASKRFQERFGLELNRKIKGEIHQKILMSRYSYVTGIKFLYNLGYKEVWKIYLKDIIDPVIVVYWSEKSEIVTFLKEGFDCGQQRNSYGETAERK